MSSRLNVGFTNKQIADLIPGDGEFAVPRMKGFLSTELWVRNPRTGIKECIEAGCFNTAWDEEFALQYRVQFPLIKEEFSGLPYRIMVIGDRTAKERVHDSEDILEWPVWTPERKQRELIKWCDELADGGRIILKDLPAIRTPGFRTAIQFFQDLQDQYPKLRFHLSGVESFGTVFGAGMFSADINPSVSSYHKKVMLPNGKTASLDEFLTKHEMDHLRNILSVRKNDESLKTRRDVFRLNLRSAQWAKQFYRKNVAYLARGFESDILSRTALHRSPIVSVQAKPQEGDYLHCEHCSLQSYCRFYREGSVCSVPGSRGNKLGEYFQTRSADDIIDGLGVLLGRASDRLEDAMDDPEIAPSDKNVTKMIDDIFKQGESLAKLIDPKLSNPKFVLQESGTSDKPKLPEGKKAKAIVDALGKAGIERRDIVPWMLEQFSSANTEDDIALLASDVANQVAGIKET